MASEAESDHASFDLHLGGEFDGLSPSALHAITSQTAGLAYRIGELADPDVQLSVRITGIRRGSLVLSFLVEQLDAVASESPTAHIAVVGLIGLTLKAYFDFIVAEVKRARRLEDDELPPEGVVLTPEVLVQRARADDVFKSRVSDLIDTARSLPEIESIGVGLGEPKPDEVIPSGYFLDVQRKLLVPNDLVTRVVTLPNHRVFLDKPVGDPAGRWQLIWWEGDERVDAVADITAKRLKTFLAERYDPEFRQVVADVEFTEILNKRTKDRVISNARITRVKHLPHRVPSEPPEWLPASLSIKRFTLPGFLGLSKPRKDSKD